MKQAAWAAALGVLAACYPGGAETVSDLDTVTTQHDSKANFASIHTYAMPSAVLETQVPQFPPPRSSDWLGRPVQIDHSNDAAILSTVAANLNKLGWQQVDPATTTAEVAVVVAFTVTRYVEYGAYPFYTWAPGWPGFAGYDATWMVYYPWDWTYETVLDAGSLRIDMLDLRSPESGHFADPAVQSLTAIWTASLDGELAGSTQSTLDRITHGIDQAFAQSPYL